MNKKNRTSKNIGASKKRKNALLSLMPIFFFLSLVICGAGYLWKEIKVKEQNDQKEAIYLKNKRTRLMKEFRAQMNVVPGIPTQFTFTPITTTKGRRDELKNPEFDYHVICNKICGNSHFNMKIKIVVETQAEYDKWMADQKATFAREEAEEAPAEAPAEENTTEPTENSGEVAMN